MDYHRIVSKLLIGSHPESAGAIERLKRETGVTAVLNLQTDDDMRYFKLDWDSLLNCYKSCGIELHRLPVRDFDAVDLQQKLPACVSALNDLLESGHTVYLHCSAGAGRSPTVAIAYLFWRHGWGLDQALAHVMQCRPCSPNLEAIRLASVAR
jgi:protein-tyrosine phosphatase